MGRLKSKRQDDHALSNQTGSSLDLKGTLMQIRKSGNIFALTQK